MKYFSLETQDGIGSLFTKDDLLVSAIVPKGINFNFAREILNAQTSKRDIYFSVADTDGEEVTSQFNYSDHLLWGWIPVFSERAMVVLQSVGCQAEDFMRCYVRTDAVTQYFLHLPREALDVVDLAESEFLLRMPVSPPLPHHITRLVLHSMPPRKHCFRAAIPGHDQVFSELIVDEEFVDRWRSEYLTGCSFRQIG